MVTPKQLEAALQNDWLLSGDKFLSESKASGYTYFKRDFLFRIGRWRDKIVEPLFLSPHKFFRKTLVVGHSDLPLREIDQKILRFMGVKNVFATNADCRNYFARALPLGLSNDSRESKLHAIFGNKNHIKLANESSVPTRNFSNSIYANFTLSNNLKERAELRKIIENSKNVTLSNPDFTESGRTNYLMSLREHNFVLCPEGNGIDTHRLWETLYMGGIPIIKSNKSLNGLVKNLPVLVIPNWELVLDDAYLETEFNRISNSQFAISELFWPHWQKVLSS
jgi:hypothetical protein